MSATTLRQPRTAALAACAALTAAVPLLGAGAGSASATTAPPHFSYTGSAYATSVNVGSVVKSGPSAPITFGCTTNPNLHPVNSTAGINLAPLATTGTVSSAGNTYTSPVQSATSATTAAVNLLSGLVRATAVKAASATARTSTGGYALSSAGTTLTNLVVAGVPVKADAAPNTRINLAGFGYLLVNEQVKHTSSLSVNGLHLFVTTTNALGVPVGANVTISHAVSGLSGPVAGVLGGYAYGTKANTATKVVSGETFEAFLPCLGTGGVLRTNTGAGINLGTALSTGTISNTDRGSVTATTATGETTSTVQAAKLLSGLLSATAIKADAHAATNGVTYTFTDTGSKFGTLAVAGHPAITATVAPNTTVALPGVGTLYLHRVIRSAHSVTVRMIELVLTSPVNGLAAGTDIKVGVAYTAAN